MNSVLMLELVVGVIVSFTLLGIFIWAAKSGQFDDKKKQMDGLLFDSEEELQRAYEKEQKIKKMKEKKEKKAQNSKES